MTWALPSPTWTLSLWCDLLSGLAWKGSSPHEESRCLLCPSFPAPDLAVGLFPGEMHSGSIQSPRTGLEPAYMAGASPPVNWPF